MRILKTSASCCGCTACESVCQHKAITMQPNDLGFLYPVINEKLCVDCGLCERVCQFTQDYKRYENFSEPLVYGARSKSADDLLQSQSGGAFYALAEIIIAEGGVVYGAGWGKDFKVVHKRADSLVVCSEFRGSKYVQSDLQGIFHQVKNDLKVGNMVLFTGTPCQVSGLKSFIPIKLQANLYTVDLICHSVSSPAIWHDYIHWIEKKYGQKIQGANFRNKKFGWHGCTESYEMKNGLEINRKSLGFLFFNHLNIRESCSECPYTNLKRVGDITIGDFWGWEKSYDQWNDNQGINLLLVNSEKGKNLFEKSIAKLEYIQSSVERCIQPQLKVPVNLSPVYSVFISDFKKRGIEYVLKKYADEGLVFKIKKHIKRLINKK